MLFPLLFMVVGMTFLFVQQTEFRHVATHDNETLREDLTEAGMPHAQVSALMSAQARIESNASSYTQGASFLTLIIPIFMAIPLYASMISSKPRLPNAGSELKE